MSKIYNPQTFTHPGEILKEKLEELDMTIKEFALRASKPEKTIHSILNLESSITSEMAVLFENILEIPAHFWLNFQIKYDEITSRNKILENRIKDLEWAKKFPYREMANFGWVKKTSDKLERVQSLFDFFKFNSTKSWEEYFFYEELKSSFRISIKHVNKPHSISAWLRKGEIEANNRSIKPYDEKAFKSLLKDIKNKIQENDEYIFFKLQTLCSNVGVYLVYTPCLPNAPISGCARWIKDNPLIQLSGRYKSNDRYWFTFYHEAGHILHHGKNDIFLEDIVNTTNDKTIEIKEKEANKFASDYLLDKNFENEIYNLQSTNKINIMNLAKKYNTHPAIIVGRLQHLKIINYNQLNELKFNINFEDSNI